MEDNQNVMIEEEESSFDFMQLWRLFKKNWKWFPISIVVCVLIAGVYLWITPTTVSVSGKMEIIDKSKKGSSGMSAGLAMLNSLAFRRVYWHRRRGHVEFDRMVNIRSLSRLSGNRQKCHEHYYCQKYSHNAFHKMSLSKYLYVYITTPSFLSAMFFEPSLTRFLNFVRFLICLTQMRDFVRFS